jgi:hypothetical protein
MADFETTMRHARAKFAAEHSGQLSRQPSFATPAITAEADPIDRDVARRLQGLDHDQLVQVAEALGRPVDDADEDAPCTPLLVSLCMVQGRSAITPAGWMICWLIGGLGAASGAKNWWKNRHARKTGDME